MIRLRAAWCRWRHCRVGQHHEYDPDAPLYTATDWSGITIMQSARVVPVRLCAIPGCGWTSGAGDLPPEPKSTRPMWWR